MLCYTLNHEGNQSVHIFCHKYRVKPIVNGKMKINIPAGENWKEKKLRSWYFQSLSGVFWCGTETLLCNCWRHTRRRTFDHSYNTETTTIGLCFLVDMADCVCNNTVFTCWYTLLSTFTLPFPQTIEPFTLKLFTLWTQNVSKYQRLTVKPSFIQSGEDPTVHMLHLGSGWEKYIQYLGQQHLEGFSPLLWNV